jgi:hypothetical protein
MRLAEPTELHRKSGVWGAPWFRRQVETLHPEPRIPFFQLGSVPQQKERGDHLLTDISDGLRVAGAVVFEGLL